MLQRVAMTGEAKLSEVQLANLTNFTCIVYVGLTNDEKKQVRLVVSISPWRSILSVALTSVLLKLQNSYSCARNVCGWQNVDGKPAQRPRLADHGSRLV
jgi:hypothetical protein